MEQVLTPESLTTNQLVEPCPDLGYTKLYLNFLAGRSPAIDFYPSRSLPEVAQQLDHHSYQREQIVGILRKQNSRYNASAETFVNIDKLTDPRAVCVFAPAGL